MAYVLGAALIGGYLDLYVFDLGTPLYGVAGGVVIGLIYIAFLVLGARKRS